VRVGGWGGKVSKWKKPKLGSGRGKNKVNLPTTLRQKENPISAPSIQVGAPVGAGSLRPK